MLRMKQEIVKNKSLFISYLLFQIQLPLLIFVPFRQIYHMQNMEVILYPKQIQIAAQSFSSVRLTYKKMSITTNHELEKYENRQSYPIKNCIAVINDQVKFKLSKQFEFHNTKIVIIVIGTKGRQVSCLGDICLDLVSLKQKKSKDSGLCKTKIDKCKDPNASFIFDVKFFQKNVDLNEMKRNKKQKIAETGVLKTDHYYKEELYISRREKSDKPTAYQISRKNYKNTQILRNNEAMQKNEKTISKEKRQSKDSAKQNTNNGSYKKRFLYEVQRNDKSSQKSSSKQIGSNYLKVYQKDKSPSPRIKTPEPITLETLKSKQTHNRTKSKVSPLKLSEFDTQKTQQLDESYELVDPETFRAHVIKSSNRNGYFQDERKQKNATNHDLSDSNISQNSLSSIKNEKDNKYKMITQKLELIQNKIRQKTVHSDSNKNIEHTGSIIGDSKVAKSESSQVEFCPVQNLNEYKTNFNQSRNYNTYPSQNPPYENSEQISSKNSQSPVSLNKSACPKNQLPPSPIQIVQTPTGNKQSMDQIKMTEFTINSRKSQISELEAPHQITAKKFYSIQNPKLSQKNPVINQAKAHSSEENQIQNRKNHKNSPESNPSSFIHRKNSRSPQSNGKRQTSPLSLSFQKRQSELKMQKKPSVGPNYLEIQVKMLQLEIQDKDMKYHKFQKKMLKKQEDFAKLSNEIAESQRKITSLSNQIIQLKTRNLDLEKKIEDEKEIELKLKEKEKWISQKQSEITNLTIQIQKLQQSLTEQIAKQGSMFQSHNEKEKSLKTQFKQALDQKDQQIQHLKSLLETYEQEISGLRERLGSMQNFKGKYQQLLKSKELDIEAIYTLKKKIKQFQAQRNISLDDQSRSRSVNGAKQQKNVKQNQLTQQMLQQTIEKQSLLQQSLQSLESRNKTLSELIQTLQKQKSQLLQQLSQNKKANQELTQTNQARIKTFENKIAALQLEKNSLLEKLQKKENFLGESWQDKQNSLVEQLQKKEKTIEKLSEVNQSLNAKLFDLQNQSLKVQQLDQQTEALLIKNAEYEQQINQLQQKLTSKEKEMKILKNLLRDRENQEKQKQLNQAKKQKMRRQLPNQQSSPSKTAPWKNFQIEPGSKSDDLSKIKVTEEGKQNFYDHYVNEKAKCTNLQAQLRYAQNQIRNHKMRIQMLVQEKNNLEQQIDKIAYGKDKNPYGNDKNPPVNEKFANGNKKQKINQNIEKKSSTEDRMITQSLKMENKLIQEEIQALQSQVRELNCLVELSIEKGLNSEQSAIFEKGYSLGQRDEIGQKYMILIRRLEGYESELRSKKNKMAEIVNAIWRGGNASLIDEIDRIMSFDA